jgi:competence protein ComEC
MDRVLALIEQAPWSGISKIWLTASEYLLLYGIIISVFYWLYSRKPPLLQLSLAFALLFAISISAKRWNNFTSSRTTVFNIKRHNCTVIKRGIHAMIITDLADTDKAYKYSVQPYLDSCQVSDVRLYNTANGADSFTLNN